jgi:hypothetical protein
MIGIGMSRKLVVLCFTLLLTPLVFGQQTGEITGKVTATDGSMLPGVTVEAKADVLPQPRTTFSTENGDYRLPLLPPGSYTVTFTLSGLEPASRTVRVLLNQSATVNVSLGLAGVSENITVTADTSLVDPDSTAIKSAVGEQQIQELPIGQEYRDLVKLAPSVQYTEDTIRGPSAGGSGQDNSYQFDGVNVTLPLFGTLSAEPSTHDIQQISVVKGGAAAIDFNRAAGFTIDSVSKSGTSELKGQVGLQFQLDSMRGEEDHPTSSFDQDRTWVTANVGGPILQDQLFSYASYYRPTVERANRVNQYGDLPDYDSNRNEYFGKLTYTPTSSILLNGSYRNSSREVVNASIGATSAPSTAVNEEATQRIGILEASWIVNPSSFATFKFTDYQNNTGSLPNLVINETPTLAAGTRLDINNLDRYGNFIVPSFRNGQPAFNTFITPIVDRYGYVNAAGVKTGGGDVGAGSQFNQQDFFRQSAQAAYDLTLGSKIRHDLHVGFQWSEDGEDLARSSNGWGVLSVQGGLVNFTPPGGVSTPVWYQAQFTRSIAGTGASNNIHTEYVSQNFEVNDTIHWNNWSFNIGVLTSNDTLYGQGLREDSSTLSGYVAAPGHQYKMYEIPWEKTIQPRLGVTWNYSGSNNVYASYAKYVPSASSLPRAASWDRAILGLTTRVHFDQNGVIIGSESVSGSAGKLFVEDLDPRYIDEYVIGTSQQFNERWSARFYGRHRYSSNFWEDTENDTLVRLAPEGFKGGLYIPDLVPKLTQLGVSGANDRAYVIAQIDGAFTKYYEVTAESDWRSGNVFLRGSYTWSHYYGNFDQDNTSLDLNDSSIFIGSSALADGAGRQIWDNKYGDLRGDRRSLFKLYGSYQLPWNGTVGAYTIYQSGQPWEPWNYEIYRSQPGFGTSTSDQNRYGEPAGRYRTDDHYQIDLTYTQGIRFGRYGVHFDLDIFNALDNQTGYNVEPSVHRTTTQVKFGETRDYFDPRRYQVAVRFEF